MDWWAQRRYGLQLHTNVAAVPAWAPIGEYSEWYAAHIDGSLPEPLFHPTPMAESLAYHRSRWPHIEHFDDFVPLLSFADFDADAWADLAVAAGMNYSIMVAKHHDGFAWWDAPQTQHSAVACGPRRNVFKQYADAFRRVGLSVGASYSLLDWHDERYRTESYITEVIHPQVLDLVRRYEIDMLWGNGNWGHGASYWRSEELIDRALAHNPELIINDRWWTDVFDVRTYKYRLPDQIIDSPWETSRSLGLSFGFNQAERPMHLLDWCSLVALLTEVVAKGGRLLLSVGPDARGRFDPLHETILREAGSWIQAHRELIDRGMPWHHWGDAGTRYILVDDRLYGVDVANDGMFAQLLPSRDRVLSVRDIDGTVHSFEQRADGLRIISPVRPTDGGPVVYEFVLAEPAAAPIELFPTAAPVARSLADAIGDAVSGQIVQLGEGAYVGPADVPPMVTIRGLGPDRTELVADQGKPLTVGSGARIEHCRISGANGRIAWLANSVVSLTDRSSLLGCQLDGHVLANDATDARVTSCSLDGVVAHRSERLHIVRSSFRGMGWDCAIDIEGGSGHHIESCEIEGSLQAIRLAGAVDGTVRGNTIRTRWTGVHLVDTHATQVVGNFISHTMRAIDVDGGSAITVGGNAVDAGDSGCLVQRGATGIEVSGNHWQSTRVGLILWDIGQVSHHQNTIVDLGDSGGELVSGPS